MLFMKGDYTVGFMVLNGVSRVRSRPAIEQLCSSLSADVVICFGDFSSHVQVDLDENFEAVVDHTNEKRVIGLKTIRWLLERLPERRVLRYI